MKIQISIYAIIGVVLSLVGPSCSTPGPHRAGEAQFTSVNEAGIEGRPTRAELQEEMLRFETRFSARVNDAFYSMSQSPSASVRRQAQRLNLYYSAAAFGVSLGPIPEQNLLDMIVFVELVHDVFRDYWGPRLFKAEGKPVLVALDQSAHDLAGVASSYLTSPQLAELRKLVDDWHHQNPNVISVESVRLSDFSAEAGAREKELERRISGIFGPVIGATAQGEKAILLGERSLHYAMRAPTFIQMQAAVGVSDIMKELGFDLSELPASPVGATQIQGLMGQSSALLAESRETLRELRPVLVELGKIVQFMDKNPKIMEGLSSLLGNTANVLREFNKSIVGIGGLGPDRIKTLALWLMLGFVSVGGLLMIFAGGVYVVSRLMYERFSAKRRTVVERPGGRRAA